MCFFFFNDTATTEIYTLSLHDALPISAEAALMLQAAAHDLASQRGDSLAFSVGIHLGEAIVGYIGTDSAVEYTRSEEHTSELQSRHISYAVFCLKKKKQHKQKLLKRRR